MFGSSIWSRPLREDASEDAVVLGDGDAQYALLDQWRDDFSIRHLVMPNHAECCTYPVLEWIASRLPAAPLNVMAKFHPDNPVSPKYRDKYAEVVRRPTHAELEGSWRRLAN